MISSRKLVWYGAVWAMTALGATLPAIASEDAPLPVPRFASLKSDEVNMRVGPGVRYNINWVYRHEGLPVEITREFGEWRKIRDADGTSGWVHKQMLQGKRTMIITQKIGILRKSPDMAGVPVLKAEHNVTGKLLSCESDWCKVQISDRKGWIRKGDIWGAFKDEKF
ncbi:MAG TPA: SH3 domain-containing protein [Rickettsiales bacterium]|nr:SH3 domain-containing protein [Rickettsiales bacterium]